MNELLYETFKELRRIGITNSGNDFSRNLLGRSSRYYSWVLASGHEPDLGAMLALYARLDDLHTCAEVAGDIQRSNAIDYLTTRIWDSIRHHSLSKGPNRRKKPGGDDARPVLIADTAVAPAVPVRAEP